MTPTATSLHTRPFTFATTLITSLFPRKGKVKEPSVEFAALIHPTNVHRVFESLLSDISRPGHTHPRAAWARTFDDPPILEPSRLVRGVAIAHKATTADPLLAQGMLAPHPTCVVVRVQPRP